MLPVVFALVSAAGAWAAWRRNPLYSTRSTLRSAAFVLLAIAAVIALLIAASNLIVHSSALVAGCTLAAIIIFGALSLIFIIQSVATPKAAKLETVLPPSATLVHIHRQKVYKLAKFFVVLLTVLGILGLVIPGDVKYVPLSFGGIALLLAAILLPVMYVNARNFDRSLTALECNPWFRWQYTAEQWKQWTGVQVERMKAVPAQFILKRDWRKLAWAFAIIAGGVAIFSPGSWLEKIAYVFFCCGLIFALVMLSTRANQRAPEKLRNTLLKVAPEAYFGHDGVFCNGVYTTWLGMNAYLISASIDERQPRSLFFHFEKVVPSQYSGNQTIPILQSVLIPASAESDIARLQRELSSRCPKAQIALT